MIQITETAAQKIRTLMARQGLDEGGLRVGVKGGGCSGLSYTFSWEKQARLGDETFDGPEGAKDRKSTRLNSSHIQKSRMPSSA